MAEGISRPEYDCAEAPPAQKQEDGSWLLPPERESRLSCLMNSCAAHRDELEKQLGEASWSKAKLAGAAFVVGAILGAGAVAVVVTATR